MLLGMRWVAPRGTMKGMGDHLVHIGEVIVNAIVFDPKNSERLRTMDLNNLLQSVQRLFRMGSTPRLPPHESNRRSARDCTAGQRR